MHPLGTSPAKWKVFALANPSSADSWMDPIDLRGPACLALLSWGSLTSSFHEDALNMATCASRYALKVLTHSHAGALCQRLYSCFVFFLWHVRWAGQHPDRVIPDLPGVCLNTEPFDKGIGWRKFSRTSSSGLQKWCCFSSPWLQLRQLRSQMAEEHRALLRAFLNLILGSRINTVVAQEVPADRRLVSVRLRLFSLTALLHGRVVCPSQDGKVRNILWETSGQWKVEWLTQDPFAS